MGLSGSEWTNDWYSTNYYEHSPERDPQGPETGTKKVLRGAVGSNPQYSLQCSDNLNYQFQRSMLMTIMRSLALSTVCMPLCDEQLIYFSRYALFQTLSVTGTIYV